MEPVDKSWDQREWNNEAWSEYTGSCIVKKIFSSNSQETVFFKLFYKLLALHKQNSYHSVIKRRTICQNIHLLSWKDHWGMCLKFNVFQSGMMRRCDHIDVLQCTMGKCTSGGRTWKWAFQQFFHYLEKLYFVNNSAKIWWIFFL